MMGTDDAQVAQGQEPKLLDRMRNVLRVKHYSKRTEHDVRTTMIYTHVLNRGGQGVISPADVLV